MEAAHVAEQVRRRQAVRPYLVGVQVQQQHLSQPSRRRLAQPQHRQRHVGKGTPVRGGAGWEQVG
jgi:hypothetical protein